MKLFREVLGGEGGGDKKYEIVRFRIYNIQNGRNGCLELALCGMNRANFDLYILQETNITDRVYVRKSVVYCAIELDASIRHCTGVAHFYKESPRFAVKSHQQHGPNVAISQLIMGGRCWHVMGCYLAPRYASTLERVVAAIGQQPRGTELFVAGDFNTDLESPGGHECNEAISEYMAIEGLEYMTDHFLSRKLLWDRY